MGSVNHPKQYDPAASASIKAAFHEIWKALEAQHAFPGKPFEAELKVAITRRLVELAADGMTNPEELKAQVLGNLPLR